MSGNFYYLTTDEASSYVFQSFKGDGPFDVLVDKERFIWEVKEGEEYIVSYEAVKSQTKENLVIYCIKFILAGLVAAFSLKMAIEKEISKEPNSADRL